MKQSWWTEVTPDICVSFQTDLSALNDGQLDPKAATRAIAHLEICAGCHDFFDDVRGMEWAHKDFCKTEALVARFSSLSGSQLFQEAESKGLVTQLASIFYQLGKAYVLLATDEQYRTDVFEPAVRVEVEKTRGRGFVDGVLVAHRDEDSDFDWDNARHMLNGRLTRIEGSLKKGIRLLDEALAIDPDCDEARLYRAFVHSHEDQPISATQQYKYVFDTAIDDNNRGHAAVQLGKLCEKEGNDHRALACFRWVVISGLADLEPRFFFVRYNAALCYLKLGQAERSIEMLRQLLDHHPEQASRIAECLASCSPKMQDRMASSPGFAEGVIERCPELFEEAAIPASHDLTATSAEDQTC